MVSFVNATLVLSIGETVEEVTDSGFLGTTPTLACHQLGEDALVQVSCTFNSRHQFHTQYLVGLCSSLLPARGTFDDAHKFDSFAAPVTCTTLYEQQNLHIVLDSVLSMICFCTS